MMHETVRLLLVEDRPTDAELAKREIRKVLAACEVQLVETREAYLSSLESFRPHLIVSDYNMPRFDGLTALKLALEHTPMTPVIILTSAINEDTAVECMKAGAADYVIKEHRKRLGQAVLLALDQRRLRIDRQLAEIALRESEERFRGLYENASIGLIRIAPDGQILMANPAAVRMLGYPSLADFAQHSLSEDGFGPTASHDEFLQRLSIDGVIAGLETTWFKYDGSTIYVRESGQAMRNHQNQILYYDGTLEDITDRKQAEAAHARLEAQLRQSQKMESIGHLAGGVAHDFNNLLTVIKGYSDLIIDEMTIDDPLRQDIEEIEKASERASALVRQLLAFSRKQILAPRVLDVNELVDNIQKMLERLIGEDITLTTVLQQPLYPIIADYGQIEQVVMNLAVNARDAMPTGGLLTIETSNVDLDDSYAGTHIGCAPGPYIQLAVTDSGFGMDSEIQGHIFEPFFTTKGPGKGTGLGLSTVYGIVKQSGGNITVYSEPGHGATFKVYLPANPASSTAVVEPRSTVTPTGGSETILLVEDEALIARLVETVLQNYGYTVLRAHRGNEALALAAAHDGPIHILITDVVMPQMSGRELAERLRVELPQVKVLFMSGYTDDTVVRHGLLNAEASFLPKPFSPGALASKVREMLDG